MVKFHFRGGVSARTPVSRRQGQARRTLEYSGIAVQTLLTLKALFHLPYRALEGFGRSLMQLFMHQRLLEWKFFPIFHVQCYPYMSFIQCNETA